MRGRALRRGWRYARGLALALALGAASGCVAGSRVPPSARVLTDPLILTFWCAPPLADLDDARATEIADAGFNIVGPPCEGPFDVSGNLSALDAVERHGLRMWVRDRRYGEVALTQADPESRIAAAAADYRGHPAVGGYFVVDEPGASDFDDVASVVGALRDADPTRLSYVNLLPDYVSPDAFGTESYEEYVERFVTRVQPALLSFDHYPFRNEDDRPSFFTNLRTVRAVALRHRIPFMMIVLAMPHGPYRDPSEAELSWQVFHALAFGARGISYFAYWTPTRGAHAKKMQFRYGLIEDGKPTLHYFQVARLNRALRAIGGQLASYRSLEVYDSLGEIGPAFPLGPIDAIDGGAITAGLFVNDRDLAALLVNRDYTYAVTGSLRLRAGAGSPEIFDVPSGRWVATGAPTVLTIPPGGARLLRWRAEGG